MSGLKQTLRWIGVLPAALLAIIVVLFPIHWAAGWIHSSEDSWFLGFFSAETLERLGDAFFVPFTFVFAGSRVAPRFKLVTGIILLILLIAGMTFTFMQLPAYGLRVTDSWFRLGLLCLLWLAGVSYALVKAYEADKSA